MDKHYDQPILAPIAAFQPRSERLVMNALHFRYPRCTERLELNQTPRRRSDCTKVLGDTFGLVDALMTNESATIDVDPLLPEIAAGWSPARRSTGGSLGG